LETTTLPEGSLAKNGRRRKKARHCGAFRGLIAAIPDLFLPLRGACGIMRFD